MQQLETLVSSTRPFQDQRDGLHRWKVLGTGVLANASFTCVIGGVPAASIFLRTQYDFTTVVMGMIMGIMGLGIALSEIPWGLVTDKLGDRRVLIIGLATTTMMLLLLSVASSSELFFGNAALLAGGLLVTGIMGSSVNGSSGRAIMTWFRPEERGFAMSIRQTAVPMGYGLGAILYPSLAFHYGMSAAYMLSAAMCGLALFLSWLWIRDPKLPEEVQAAQKVEGNGKHPLASLHIWKIVAAIGILCAPQFAIMTFTAIFLYDVVNVNIVTISAILFTIQISAIPTRILSGKWTDRMKNRKSYLKSAAFLSAAMFALLALSTFGFTANQDNQLMRLAVIVSLFLAGIIVSAWHGVGYTELASEAGAGKVATALSMGNAAVFLVLFVTPTIIPIIAQLMTWSGAWALMAALCLVAMVFFPARDT